MVIVTFKSSTFRKTSICSHSLLF